MVLGLIPSRYASTRFPGKPLTIIDGKSMIRRVYEQCIRCGLLDDLYVATDDKRIAEEVESFGGKFIFTGVEHSSGTERCREAAGVLGCLKDVDIVVNIQGDEPFIDPEQIEKVIGCFSKNEDCMIATLKKRISSDVELLSPNVVKVVCRNDGKALYFSRYSIPYCRDVESINNVSHFKHIGIYAYRGDVLNTIAGLSKGCLESAENLEQLRWMEAGFDIYTVITDSETIAVDTVDDLIKIQNYLRTI